MKARNAGLVLAGAVFGYALGASAPERATGATISLEDRVKALEEKTQDITRGVSSDGRVPYLQVNARVGVFTNYWSKMPVGQGAALSVGTNIDRFAGYFEVDEVSTPDHPTTALFASVVAPNYNGQPNVAIEAHAKNAPAGTVGLFADTQYSPGSPLGTPVTPFVAQETDGSSRVIRTATFSANAITLKDGLQSITEYDVQKVGSAPAVRIPLR